MKLNVLIISLILPIAAYSQFWLGLKGGVNFSTVKFDSPNFNSQFKNYLKLYPGVNYGIDGDLYFTEALSLKINCLYTQKGFKYDQTYIYGYKRYNYFLASFAGKIDLNPFEKNVFALSLAPYLAYWKSGEQLEGYRKTHVILRDQMYLKADTNFAYNRIDAGVVFAVYLLHSINRKMRFNLSFGYELGMVSTAKENVLGTFNRNFFIDIAVVRRIKL